MGRWEGNKAQMGRSSDGPLPLDPRRLEVLRTGGTARLDRAARRRGDSSAGGRVLFLELAVHGMDVRSGAVQRGLSAADAGVLMKRVRTNRDVLAIRQEVGT